MERLPLSEKIFRVVNAFLLCVFALIVIIPIWTVIMNSFVSEAEIARRGVFFLIPEEWDFTAYRLLLSGGSNILNAYKNTLFIVGVATGLNLIFTITFAYGLSKKYIKGRVLIIGLVFFSMLFNGGLIPDYLLVKSLGLVDSRWAVICPFLVNSWFLFIMRNFFYAIPVSLEEAAYLDGANPLQTLVRVVLPLSLPAIATIGLFYAVFHWNAWFHAMLYITDNSKLPMQNILRNIVASSAPSSLQDLDPAMYAELEVIPPSQAVKSATIIVGTVPILIVYPFVQKYFVKGVMVGSVKG